MADEMGRTATDLLRWMLQVAEARDGDPRARTVNMKFTAATLRMWRARVRELPEFRPKCPYCRRANCAADPCSTELMARAHSRPTEHERQDGDELFDHAVGNGWE